MQKVIRTRPGLNPHPHDDRGLMSATRPPGGLISSTHNMLLVPHRRTDRTPERHRIACTCAWRVRERRWYSGPRFPFRFLDMFRSATSASPRMVLVSFREMKNSDAGMKPTVKVKQLRSDGFLTRHKYGPSTFTVQY